MSYLKYIRRVLWTWSNTWLEDRSDRSREQMKLRVFQPLNQTDDWSD